ncbi:type II toxin-antitoxin system VapC family toxin [Paracoccus aerodenitrificans]|uniref:type II toxin-antitoxin system VapC family toxin n=1 Tax=Paracoccus aerodenitrificans TaxID=3017781 RepID=UPI0022F049D3|nr:type II toxin-antitoxin system VapC family toxin [Paracoccus aerodenitrificans]WBU63586.1 type II toxin-antitoxin system VapC family toxin [Paracoccus aerodenitrificans]
MTAVLLDTHAFVWSLFKSSELSASARTMMEAADAVYVAPISFYEITQKHRLGKWRELDPVIGRLLELWRSQGSEQAPYTAEIAFLAGAMHWAHRDPFDRMIAATAIGLGCPLISKDTAFDDLKEQPGWKGRFWDISPPDDPAVQL